eukprot:5545935-Prymnesium_polylepis.1
MDDLQVLCSSTAPPSAPPGPQFPPSMPPSPPMSPPPPPTTPQVCNNQCRYSSDGNCDDGGSGSEYSACDFATDCVDCGGRDPSNAPPPPS